MTELKNPVSSGSPPLAGTWVVRFDRFPVAPKILLEEMMSEIPSDLYYTEEHEYLRRTDEEGVFAIGVTDYAQGELGDVVFVELPDGGTSFNRMDVFGTIEAVKAVSDLFCPLQGEVVAVNDALDDDPSLVNTDPYGDGWMIKLKLANPGEVSSLLSADGYADHIS